MKQKNPLLSNSMTWLAGLIVIGAVIIIWVAQPLATRSGSTLVSVSVPADFSGAALYGQQLFNTNCATCHGANAAGQDGVAPPLVHRIYEPSHHGDSSFQRAVANGVRAHHWPFGDMPPVAGLARHDVVAITAFIRELQQENGIF